MYISHRFCSFTGVIVRDCLTLIVCVYCMVAVVQVTIGIAMALEAASIAGWTPPLAVATK